MTDIGLADELGMHRTTIAASAARLAAMGFITICADPGHPVQFSRQPGRSTTISLPPGWRSPGAFPDQKPCPAASKILNWIQLRRTKSAGLNGGGSTGTVPAAGGPPIPGAGLSPRDHRNFPAAVSVQPTDLVSPTDINREEDEEEEELFRPAKNDQSSSGRSLRQVRVPAR